MSRGKDPLAWEGYEGFRGSGTPAPRLRIGGRTSRFGSGSASIFGANIGGPRTESAARYEKLSRGGGGGAIGAYGGGGDRSSAAYEG